MTRFSKIGTTAAAVALLAFAGPVVLAQPAPAPSPGRGAPAGTPAPGGAGAPAATPSYGAPTATVFTSKIGFFTMERDAGAQYPRVIQLKFGPNKGTLLATYSHRGTLPIWRSTDNGDTWSLFSEVPQLRGQPC